MSGDNPGPFRRIPCAICGKLFVKQVGSIYHLNFAGKTYQCCSYTCYQEAKRVKDANNESQYAKYRKELK